MTSLFSVFVEEPCTVAIGFMVEFACPCLQVKFFEFIGDHMMSGMNGDHGFNARPQFNARQEIGEEIVILIEAHLELTVFWIVSDIPWTHDE